MEEKIEVGKQMIQVGLDCLNMGLERFREEAKSAGDAEANLVGASKLVKRGLEILDPTEVPLNTTYSIEYVLGRQDLAILALLQDSGANGLLLEEIGQRLGAANISGKIAPLKRLGLVETRGQARADDNPRPRGVLATITEEGSNCLTTGKFTDHGRSWGKS